MGFLSWFKPRPAVEYFDCAQFDRVAKIVGVRLAPRNRYSLKSHVGAKAIMNHRTRTIRFDKKWFLGLSPEARCALLVHEVWHIASERRAIRARMLRRSYFIALPILSFAATWLIAVVVSMLTSDSSSFVGLPVLLYPALVVLGYPYGQRWWNWPVEYECDEAAVRFMGLSATKGFLRTLKLKSNRTTHPPTKKRLVRADTAASKYPIPVIDFNSLEGEVGQELVYR